MALWASPQRGAANASAAHDRSAAQPSGQVRCARPDGGLGVGTVSHLTQAWLPAVEGGGVVALRDVERLGGLDLRWTSADDLALARASAAAVGVTVDATAWHAVYTASRRYLVPD